MRFDKIHAKEKYFTWTHMQSIDRFWLECVNLVKRRTKMYHVSPLGSSFYYFDNFKSVKLVKRLHMRPIENFLLRMDLSNLIGSPVIQILLLSHIF